MVRLHVRLSDGNKFSIEVDSNLEETTVGKVKELLQDEHGPPSLLRLIYKGRILDDDRLLSDYSVMHDSTLHLVKVKGNAAPKNNIASAAPINNTPAPPVMVPSNPPNMNTMGNPFSTPIPGASIGMTNPNDISPEMMSQVMNSPMMQSLFDNPDLFRSMMQMNPQTQQLMEENPQLREIMNDPQLLRQTLEMVRNPQAMQHMMRSQELAMSQLENLPGGFSALSNMYRNIQEPMMDAMSSGNQSNSTSIPSSQRSDSLAGATGAAMPNPWGTPSTTSRTNNPSSNTSPANSQTVPPFSMTNNPWGMPSSMPNYNPWGLPSTSAATDPMGLGGPPTPQQLEQTLQMLENPMMAQMMDSFMSNPAMVQQMMQSNPMIQQMMQSNPHAARMFQDPQFLRSMMQPNTIRSMMQLQQQMPQSNGGLWTGAPPFGSMPPSANAASPSGSLDFSNLLSSLQSTQLNGSTLANSQQPQQHPSDRYRTQLQSLRDMGFDDEQASLRALVVSHGNLNRAVDSLLMGDVPDHVPGLESTSPASDNADSNGENNTTEN
jgi:ubiquilin